MNEPMKQNNYTGLEVAVIGMAGKFPGARDIDRFWENLKNGIESISFFSAEELEESGFDGELIRRPGFVKAKGILEGVEYFDASFFGYTPGEADIMDPQYRVLHQCVWEALENASYDPNAYEGLIGLYAGASLNSYWIVRALLKTGTSSEVIGAVTLNGLDALCMRISYKLNLRGPAITVQSACSTSLVAIHLACQGLIIGECDMALAGGVSVTTPEKSGYLYEEGMIYSPDGHCKTFDAAGKGMNGGNGAGVVVLKRLEDAVEDKDYIYAIVKGSAINNDGSRKVGYTAASVEGQAAVIREAHRVAQVEPESIGCIEAHGTATPMGDPIEIEALKKAFNTNKKAFCSIGSVKSNLGHLDAAAGSAGFIKAVLSVRYRLIPPTLHFETPNPQIGFISSPFYVNTMLSKFENGKYPLRVGISSFALGGTNAHVILEEWPREMRKSHQEAQLILLSAQTPSSLEKMGQNLAKHFKENPGINLADAAYTLQVGRHIFQCRQMFVCSGLEEAVEILTAKDTNKIYTSVQTDKDQQPGSNELPLHLNGLAADGQERHQREDLLRETGKAWLKGAGVDWQAFQGKQKGQRIPLPTYPFELQSFDISVKDLLNNYSRLMGKNHEYLTEEKKVPLQKALQKEQEQPVHIVPQDDIERKIAAIFGEVLGIDQLSLDMDFFELHGDSLKAITLTSKIHKEFNVIIRLEEVFKVPTIVGLSKYIKEAAKVKFKSLEFQEKKEYYPLSSAQRRLYTVQQMDLAGIGYNLPFVLVLEGGINKARLEDTIEKMLERHDSLRTSFLMIENEPRQQINKYVDFSIEYYDVKSRKEDPIQCEFGCSPLDVEQIINKFVKPFDLAKAPLMRVGLIKEATNRHILMLDIHHIISDGFSLEILKYEFVHLYIRNELSVLKFQYKDFSEWQNQLFVCGIMKEQKEYWLNVFKDTIPTLNLPTDYQRTSKRISDEGDSIKFLVSEELTAVINVILNAKDVTMFMFLLALYNILLSKYTGQEDLVVVSPITGRKHDDLQNIIGMFVNMLAMRNQPEKDKSFGEFLEEVKKNAINAYENQDYQFEELVRELGLQGNIGRNQLLNSVFTFQNIDIGKNNSHHLEGTNAFNVTPYEYRRKTSVFNLHLIAVEVDGRINMSLEYSTHLFKKSTVENMSEHFLEILNQVLENPGINLKEVKMTYDLMAMESKNIDDQMDFAF